MHTLASPGQASPSVARAVPVRVAVAGATGYTGQELLRWLSRHPGVRITMATSSGPSTVRPLPALARLWDGSIEPLDPDRHDRAAFSCGVDQVDNFFRKTANKLGWFPMFVAHEANCIGCMLCYQICPDFCINVAPKQTLAPAVAG